MAKRLFAALMSLVMVFSFTMPAYAEAIQNDAKTESVAVVNESVQLSDDTGDATPPADDDGDATPPADDDGEATPPADDDGEATPPADDDGDATPPADDDGEATPPADDDGEATPPADDDGEATPPADDDGEAIPPADDDGEATPPADDDGDATPPADDDGEATPPADDDGEQLAVTTDFSADVEKQAIFNEAYPDEEWFFVLDCEPSASWSYDPLVYQKSEFAEDTLFTVSAYKVVEDTYAITDEESGAVIGEKTELTLWYQVNVIGGTVEGFEDGYWIMQNYLNEEDIYPYDVLTLIDPPAENAVTVSGALPAGATLSATVPGNSQEFSNAFDIKILKPNGTEWQPIDEGKTVTVSIPVDVSPDCEYVNVFHIIDHHEAIRDDAKILSVSGAPAEVRELLRDAIAACGENDCIAVEVFENVSVVDGRITIEADSFSIYVYDEVNEEFDLAENQSGEVKLPNITGGTREYYYSATAGSTFKLLPEFFGLGSYSLESNQTTGVNVKTTWEGLNGRSAEVALNNVAVGDTVVVKYTGSNPGNNFWVYITIVREITITYNDNGKTATGMPDPLSKQIATDGTIKVTAAAAPSAANCTFKGWDTSNAGNGTRYQAGEQFVPLQDTELFAIWEEDKYNVTFNPNGGSGEITTQSVEHGETIIFPEAPIRENYTFLGWCASTSGSSTRYQAGDTTTVEAAATYYAIWGADLTFTLSGNIAETKMMEGTEFDWKDVTGFSQAGNSYNMEDVEGFYKGTTFRVKAAGDSNFNAGAGKAYTSTGSAVKFWTEDGGKTLFIQLTEGVTKDTTITITTEKDRFTVSYVPNGGTAVAPDEGVASGTKIDPNSKTTTREGYSFAGWYSDAALTKKVTDAVTITAHTTFYAKWTVSGYTITYNLGGGVLGDGVTNPIQYNTETETFTLNNPTKAGYTFAGWTGTGLMQATMIVTVATGSTGNRNYTATWTENKAVLSYIAVGPDGESNFGTVTPASEEVFVVTGIANGSVAQAGDRYRFVGWYANAICTQQVSTDATFVPTKGENELWSNNTYYAKFDYAYADLTISSDCSDTSQNFIFTVTGSNNFSIDVVVRGNESVTIKNLLIGTYTVTENTDWSWRYPLADNEKTIALVAGGSTVTFRNERTVAYWLSGDSYCENQWGGGTVSRKDDTEE